MNAKPQPDAPFSPIEATLRESAERQHRPVDETLQTTAKFRAIFDQAGVFAGIMSTDGTAIEANRLSLETCRYTLEQVAGPEFWNTPRWAGNAEVQEKIRAATRQAAGGDPYTAELPYVWADGSKHIVQFALHPVRDDQGRVILLHPTGIDVTERKKSELRGQAWNSRPGFLTPCFRRLQISCTHSIARDVSHIHQSGTAGLVEPAIRRSGGQEFL